jgi:Saxitoxin biosynthesis operon protein SxtJ
MIDLNLNPSKRELKIFSLGALVFLTIVAWLVWRKSGSTTAVAILVALGVAIAALGLIAPRIVRPLFIALMVINYPIGWVMTHIVMAVIFYLVVTPLAAIMKLAGRDPMERRFDRSASTYWKSRPTETDPGRYFRQF